MDETYVKSRYALADRIATKLEELPLLPRTHRMPNVLMVGETNNGKKGLVSRFVRQDPPQNGDGEGHVRAMAVSLYRATISQTKLANDVRHNAAASDQQRLSAPG